MKLRSNLAIVISLLALVVGLGGTAVAAVTLAKDSVGSAQLKKNSVGANKIKNRSIGASKLKADSVTSGAVANGTLTAGDFRAGTLLAGPKGERGLPGERGADATNLIAVVEGGNLIRGLGTTGFAGSNGDYTLTFNRGLTRCVAVATVGTDNASPAPALITTSVSSNRVQVRTTTTNGTLVDRGFYLAVLC